MSHISTHIASDCLDAISHLTEASINDLPHPVISRTKKEFEGDYTLVVFPYVKVFRSKPEEAAKRIGDYLMYATDWLESFNVVKGFLNLKVKDQQWLEWMDHIGTIQGSVTKYGRDKVVTVEFSSPNTNKPLHLGHIRNILLGWSASRLLEETGHEVIKTQIVNDRGIAICKSMLAWLRFGNGDTPESTDTKGDHFVGKYYVLFESKFQEEYSQWQQTREGKEIYSSKSKDGESESDFFKRYKNEYFNTASELGKAARDLLKKWENDDEQTVDVWRTMNQWVYDGFDVTYQRLGVDFDKIYYESNTYLKGKDIVEEGLENGVFYKEEDGSVWADLTDVNMDKKIVLRSDGTALYITQDLGTAQLRYDDFEMQKAVYVVADEQDYHFQVLFELMKRLGRPFADDLHHLSYGMVDLPSGKMKSREGTVVDADDLVEEVIGEARKGALERGELSELSEKEKNEIFDAVGLGALKYFILKVNPKKRMTFDPQDSLDMQGQTGPYIQNAYVRINSVLKRAEGEPLDQSGYIEPSEFEKNLLKSVDDYSDVLLEAAKELDPSTMANYLYNLAKEYHRFYHEHRILTAETDAARSFRLNLSTMVSEKLKAGMDLLGIGMPKKM